MFMISLGIMSADKDTAGRLTGTTRETLEEQDDTARPFAARLPVMIHGQYLKDLSFENPNAPQILRGGQGKPVMDVNFSMEARNIDPIEGNDRLYEVTLGVEATAKRGERTAFICEVQYAVLVSVGQDVPEDQIHPLLLIEMPRFAFPFVRQIVADMTQSAGFMPLLMAPVDFRAFYVQRFGGKDRAAAAKTA